MKPRISMLTLGVRDLERSVRFYELGLGFPPMESPPEVAFFTLNGSWLGLYGREALAEDAGVARKCSAFVPTLDGCTGTATMALPHRFRPSPRVTHRW